MFQSLTAPRPFVQVARIATVVLLALAVSPSQAAAQISAVSGLNQFSFWGTEGLVKGTDVEYDPVNDVFLVVASCYSSCGAGAVYGRFVNRSGAAVGGIFNIASGANGHFPRAVYRAESGGTGDFLVAWSEEHSSGGSVFARVVRYNPSTGTGLQVGSVSQISDGGTPAWLEAGPAIGYSTKSRRFLVAWMAYAPFRVVARGLDATGAPITAITQLSDGYGQDPAIAWNSATDEFGVSFSAENSAGSAGYSVFAKVSASTGAFTRQSFNSISGFARITDVAYNATTNRWVMAWAQALFGGPGGQWETQVAEVGSDGSVTAMGLATRRWVGYNSVSLDWNPVSGTFLLASLPASDELSGLELNGNGYAISAVSTIGSGATTRYARVTANHDQPEWAVSFSNNYESGRVVTVATTSTGGGAAGSLSSASGQGSGGSTPAPAPAPTPPASPSASTCTTPDPFTAIGGGTCVGNNNWVPGAPSTPAPSTPSTPAPTPDPPTSSGGGSSVPACTAVGSSPVPGWVCVGDGWVPADHPLASQAAPPQNNNSGNNGGNNSGGGLSVCSSTPGWAVGGGWVRVGAGDWVPATHPLASQAVCRGQ